MTPSKIVMNFIEKINCQDVEGLSDLMTEDYIFIDSWGTRYEGRKTMEEGWKAYFYLFPDYRIEVADIFESNGKVFLFGFAGATFSGHEGEMPERSWHLPAAWRAIVSNGKIKSWQVYADTKIPFDIIGKFSDSDPFTQNFSK